MINTTVDRKELVESAIGTAVLNIIEKGMVICKDNIIYELEKMKAASNEVHVKSITAEAADSFRNHK